MTKPVLIVGAGPVGLTMACELARYGVPVRILDKASRRTDKSKALVLWSRTLELLDRGASADAFVAAGHKAYAMNFHAAGDTIGRVDMAGIETSYPFALMLPQSETERLLEERLASLGVTLERGLELTAFHEGAGSIEAVLRHANAREEAVSASWLIGCDGAHSTVRHALGVPFAGETMLSDFVLADVSMTGYPHPDSELSIYWHRDGILTIFPIVPGRYRIVADMPHDGSTNAGAPLPVPQLADVQALVARRGPARLAISDPTWLSSFRVNARKVANYRRGRVFLAGDAAHVHSPAGGQGMNTGMQDAFNLAWKLALVVRGEANECLLDSYSAERGAIGEDVLKTAGILTTIGTLRNPLAQGLRNLAGHLAFGLSPVRHALAEAVSEIAVAYPDSPLNGPARDAPGPAPGSRIAPVSGQTPPGAGSAPRFALFAAPGPGIGDLLARFTTLLDPNAYPRAQGEGLQLVRPDGYLAASADEPGAIAAYLEGLR